MTFDEYWPGRPSKWFGSFAAVTVPDSFADGTLLEIWLSAVLASSGLLAAGAGEAPPFPFDVCCDEALLPLLQAVRLARSAAVIAVVVRVLFTGPILVAWGSLRNHVWAM
ncbi:hypothetical protein ABT187_45340 [Streptomyces sp. NPDC001817]|uniref:hypothetical protein n=1 Tax=Streptomyces sp. NPDC001817 TaxID=3154398 RepID=UPI003328865B